MFELSGERSRSKDLCRHLFIEAEFLRPAGLHEEGRGRRFQSGPVGGEVGVPGLKPGRGAQRELIKWSGGAAVRGTEHPRFGGCT